MKIGENIRKYRKEKNLTQEKMADCLGVSAPAVNKWERGVSCPDITLLAPIARLLNISLDTLLAYEEELSKEEIYKKVSELEEKLLKDSFEDVFKHAMNDLQEYPNCELLLLYYAQLLDSWRITRKVNNTKVYDEKIQELYKRLLVSNNQENRHAALVALIYNCMHKKEYEQAQKYLDQVPVQEFNRTNMQAHLYRQQGNREAAYPLFETMVYKGYSEVSEGLLGLCHLAMEEDDVQKAKRLTAKLQEIAKTLEMSKYAQIAPQFEIAVWQKDEEACLDVLEGMVRSMRDITSFTESQLYMHMGLNGEFDISFMAGSMLEDMIEDEENNLSFIKDKKRLHKILKGLEELSL